VKFLPEKEHYSDPTTSPRTWSKPEYCSWLLHRGLDASGKIGGVKKRVLDIIESNEVPTILTTKGASINLVSEMIFAKTVMLHLCMTRINELQKFEKIHSVVRFFLDLYKEFDDKQNDAKYLLTLLTTTFCPC
jgi:hypothetical protein